MSKIAQGEAECNFDCYEYNYSLIALKRMQLPTNHIALPMTLYPYLRITMSSNLGRLTNPVAPVMSCIAVACSFSW